MTDEKPSVAPIVLEENDKVLTGKQAAEHLMKTFGAASNLNVHEDRGRDVLDQLTVYE